MSMIMSMDVHKDSHTVLHMDEKNGDVLDRYDIKNSLRELDKIIRKIPKDTKIVMEACPASKPVYKHFRKAGFEVHLAHPRKVRLIAESKKKNDDVDCEDLANLLRTGYLPEAYIPDDEIESLRRIVRHRVGLGQRVIRVKNQIHAILTMNGITSKFTDIFGVRGLKTIKKLKLPEVDQIVLEGLLRELGYLRDEQEIMDTKLASIAADNKLVKLLMTIPGIDYYSALVILSEIADINRFPTAKKLTSFAGLVPSVRITNKTKRYGHITKEGPGILRWILDINAHGIVKVRDSKLRRYYLRLSKRIGKNKAIIATARKLLIIIYHMLKEGREYEERDDDLTYRKHLKLNRISKMKTRSELRTRLDNNMEKGIEMLIASGGD